MERIEAIIRPERLNLVKDALAEAGLVGLNATPVTGRGAQVGIQVGGPRGIGSFTVDMLPKVKLELVVREDQTQQAIEIICENALTGNLPRGSLIGSFSRCSPLPSLESQLGYLPSTKRMIRRSTSCLFEISESKDAPRRTGP